MSLRTRLWLVLAALVLAPLLLVGVLLLVFVPRLSDRATASALTQADRTIAAASGAVCSEIGGVANAGGQSLLLARVTSPQVVDSLLAGKRVDAAAVLGRGGRVLAAAGRLPAGSPRFADLPSCSGEVVAGAPVMSERVSVRVQALPDVVAIVVARSITAASVGGIDLGLKDPDVVLASGPTVVAASPGTRDAAGLVRAWQAREKTHADGTFRFGGSLVYAHRPHRGVPVTVLVAVPAYPRNGMLLLWTVLIVVGGVTLALVIGRQYARDLTLPLAELGDAVAGVAAGDLTTRVTVHRRDEIGKLAESFNDMTAELAAQRSELERSQDEVRAGLERLQTTLSSTHDVDRLLQVVLGTAVSATRAQGGVVCQVDHDLVTAVAVEGAPGGDDRRPRGLRVGEGILGRIAQGGIAIGKVGSSPDLLPTAQEPHGRYVLGVPVRRGERVVGVLAVYDREDARTGAVVGFGRAQQRELQSLAGSAATAFENVLLHQEAQRLSITDPLTGLGNYRLLSTTLSREIERASRFGRPLSVLMLDIDHFKRVNDEHGHPRGDAVLRELAHRLTEQLREVDLLARYGGEEFAVVLPETDEDGAIALAERIGHALRRVPFTEGGEPPLAVTASVGVAMMTPDRATPALLLRAADGALYEAKRSGRDRAAVAPSAGGAIRVVVPS